MDLKAIQAALERAQLDGWLFCDFHHRDPLAYSILGLDKSGMTTRRWFYFLPSKGEPIKLVHKVEPRKLDALPGETRFYLAHTELRDGLGAILTGKKRVAMQYSPMNNIPYVGIVDAGTIELVRSFGVDVVSSADLVQRFEAVTGEEGYESHCAAGDAVQQVKDDAFKGMDEALRKGQHITEYDVREFILAGFENNGLTSDGDVPIVAFNEHAADPHFEPTKANAKTLHHGDTILVDVWARNRPPGSMYYDITWCGFAGQNPPAMYAEIWNTATKARDAGLELVRQRFADHKPCHGYEVDDAVRAVITEAGFGPHFVHRTGHSVGSAKVHGNGANIDNLETKDERALVPGTCFSIEPGIYLAERMAVRAEIDVFIRPSGEVVVHGPIQQELIRIG